MTKKTDSPLSSRGDGRGKKLVTKPQPKKRGANAAKMPETIAKNRQKYPNMALVPTHLVAETVDPNKPLTEKAKLFVKFWAQGETIATAAARAGYGDSATYCYKLARYPQAVALYNEEKRLYEEASQMTRKKVMDGLLEGIEMAKLVSEPASVINGWKTIGQMCGYFEPIKKNINVTVKGNVTMRQMSGMSDAELLKVIQEGVSEDLAALEHEEEADGAGD